MADKLLQMGRIGRAHGIKGDIGLDWHGEYIPVPGDVIYIETEQSLPEPYHIASVRKHNNKLIFSLKEISSRTDAEKLTGYSVFIAKDTVPPLKPGEAFAADLSGKEVFLENGEKLGILEHIEFPAQQMVWVIKDEKNNEILFPARREFIKELDVANSKIIIAPPQGLLEIYRA